MTTANEGYEVILVRHGTCSTTRGRAFLEPVGGGSPDDPFTLDYYLGSSAVLGALCSSTPESRPPKPPAGAAQQRSTSSRPLPPSA